MPHGGPKHVQEAALEAETTADGVGLILGAVAGGAAGLAAVAALGPAALAAPHLAMSAFGMAIGGGAKAGVKLSKALRE